MCLWLLDVSVKTLCRVSHESRIKQTCDVIRPHTHPHIANTAPMKWALIGLVSVDQIEIEVFNNHISLFFKHLSLRLFIRPSTHHVHFFAYSRRVWHRPCVTYRLKQEVICHQRFPLSGSLSRVDGWYRRRTTGPLPILLSSLYQKHYSFRKRDHCAPPLHTSQKGFSSNALFHTQ